MKILFALLLVPNFLLAGWTVGYTAIDFDDVVDLGALYASYTWKTSEKVEVELGLGVGVTDDSADYVDSGVSVSAIAELDPSLLLRGKYLVNENFFVGLSAGRIAATGTAIACAGGSLSLIHI